MLVYSLPHDTDHVVEPVEDAFIKLILVGPSNEPKRGNFMAQAWFLC